MQITTYINSSDNNVLDKQITQKAQYSAVGKEPIDILNPKLIINDNTFDVGINYVYIPDFKRYYYCSITTLSKNIYQLNCSVDVLKTYAEGIKASQGTITISQNAKGLIADNQTVLQANSIIRTRYFSGDRSFKYSFILATMGV